MIAEFQFDSSLLEPTLAQADGADIGLEGLDAAESVPLRSLLRVEGTDPERARTALEADPTAEHVREFRTGQPGRLFRAEHSGDDPGVHVYHISVERDGLLLGGSRTAEGWEWRMRFPDREAFSRFREDCEGESVPLQVRALFDAPAGTEPAQFGISDPQHEILLLAAEHGYFEVPRGASLADLGAELDVSSQAASERLRRGLGTLVENTILEDR